MNACASLRAFVSCPPVGAGTGSVGRCLRPVVSSASMISLASFHSLRSGAITTGSISSSMSSRLV
jgi:hypothetical protein